MIFRRVLLAIALLFAITAPSAAQFADQATYAGAGGGSANAQTITLANASSMADVQGVIVKYIPSVTNTTAATISFNGFTPVAVRRLSGSGVAALIGGELTSGQPTFVMYDGTFINVMSPTALPVGSRSLQGSAVGFNAAPNLALSASVATNALTVSVKGIDGSNPSTSNPVLIPFRNNTIATGTPLVVTQDAALTFTVNSGNTMGCVSAQMCRLWVIAICSSGLSCTNSAGTDTVGLCLFNALNPTTISIAGIDEAALWTSASGTSGGSSTQTLYCSISAVTSRAIRILGYVDIQEVTAGTWATGPTVVQVFGPGIKRPGEVVQVATGSSTTEALQGATGTFTSLSGGVTVSITPKSAANVVRVVSTGQAFVNTSGSIGYLRLVRSSTQVGGIMIISGGSSTVFVPSYLMGYELPNTTSSITYNVQAKYTSSGAIYYPCNAACSSATGVIMEVWEIMSANDNAPPPATMVG